MEVKLLYGSIAVIVVFSCTAHVADVPDTSHVQEHRPAPTVPVDPPSNNSNTVLGDASGLSRVGGIWEENTPEENIPEENTPEDNIPEEDLPGNEDVVIVDDPIVIEEERDPVIVFNEAIVRIVERTDQYIKLLDSIDRGHSNPSLKTSQSSRVLYRYVLRDDLATYVQPYDYRFEDAPELDQLLREGYMKTCIDNRDVDSSYFWYGRHAPSLKLVWDGNRTQPILQSNSLIEFHIFKRDETIYDEIEAGYHRNDFRKPWVLLHSPLSKISWIHNEFYSMDPRYTASGTQVVLILYLYIAFRDDRTDELFYRLIPWDIEAIKSNPEPYIYLVENARR